MLLQLAYCMRQLGQAQVLGSPLVVTLPRTLEEGEEVVLEVQFSTSPSSTALQWLDPSQTAGGTEPYLFSQCQAIHARSFVPCQVHSQMCTSLPGRALEGVKHQLRPPECRTLHR